MAGDTQFTEQAIANRAYDPPVTELAASAARTTSGQSSGVDVGPFDEAILLLNVTAASGTSPTLDIKIQTSHDNSDWYDTGTAFTQITATSKPSALKVTNFGKYVRAAWTIGGTSPSFTFSLQMVAKTNGT